MFIPSGSGLIISDRDIFAQPFSITDGTGYIPRFNCKETGFAANRDRLVYPPPSAQWAATGGLPGFWNPAPYRWVSVDGGLSNAYSTNLPVLGDQWVFVSVDRLKKATNGAGSAGVGVGVLARFDPFSGFGGTGYYAMGAIAADSSERYEFGIQSGATQVVQGSFTPRDKNGILIKVTGGAGQTITVSMYKGTVIDFLDNTMTLLGSFSIGTGGSNRFLTGYPAVFGSAGSAAPDTTEGDLSRWLAGDIGNC